MSSKGSFRGIIAIVSFVIALFLSGDFQAAIGAGARSPDRVFVAQAAGGVSKEGLLNIPTGAAVGQLRGGFIIMVEVEAYDPDMANKYPGMYDAAPEMLEKGENVVLVETDGKVSWLYIDDDNQRRRRDKKKNERSPQREKVGEGKVLNGKPGGFFGSLTSGKIVAGLGAAALIAVIIEASTGGSKKKAVPPPPGPGADPGTGPTTTTPPASTSTGTGTSTSTSTGTNN